MFYHLLEATSDLLLGCQDIVPGYLAHDKSVGAFVEKANEVKKKKKDRILEKLTCRSINYYVHSISGSKVG